MKTLRSIFLLVALSFAVAAPVHQAAAQQSQLAPQPLEEWLPIQVKLLYYKLLGETPNFEAIVKSNPTLQKKKDDFGFDAIILQHTKMLETMYEDIGTDNLIYARTRVLIAGMKANSRVIALTPPTADQPILFEAGSGEHYGVFIRNAEELTMLKDPYIFDNISLLYSAYASNYRNLNVDFILQPVVADTKDFILPNNTPVKAIVADVVEIRILSPNNQDVYLQKRFDNWNPGNGTSLLKDSIDSLPKNEDMNPKPMSDVATPPPVSKPKGSGIR